MTVKARLAARRTIAIALVTGAALTSLTACSTKAGEVAFMRSIVDQLQVPAGWPISEERERVPGFLTYSGSDLNSFIRVWQLEDPMTKDGLEQLLENSGWGSKVALESCDTEEPDSCIARGVIDGYSVIVETDEDPRDADPRFEEEPPKLVVELEELTVK
jgi:hypothetical protein